MNYVYVLKSKVDNELYIGSTNDLKRRISEHNSGKNISTNPRKPFELIYYEAYKSIGDARKREKSLKLRGNAKRHLMDRIHESTN